MSSLTSRTLVLLVTAVVVASPWSSRAAQQVAPAGEETFQATARGFGDVAVRLQYFGDKRQASLTTFSAKDEAHARICASKRLADLLGFGDLKLIDGGDLPGTLVELKDGGYWLLGTEGSQFQELYAPDRQVLTELAKSQGAAKWKAVEANAYPRWLDCFDNSGVGVWTGGGGGEYSIPSDFEWLRDRKLTMCAMAPRDSRMVQPGVVDTTVFDWTSTMAAKYGLAYRQLLFPSAHEWLWNRSPLPYVIPEAGRTLAAPFLQTEVNSCALTFEPVSITDEPVADLRMRLSERLRTDENCIGMHGCTEVPDAGVNNLAAVQNTPGIRQYWHDYLSQVLGMDLATVGLLHYGDRDHYRSWDEVQVPHSLDFLGWDPSSCLDLKGTWQMHEDPACVGQAQQWFDPDKAPADWVEGDCNDSMIQVYKPRNFRAGDEKHKLLNFWMRRVIDVPANRLDSLQYLHIARSSFHGVKTPIFEVWVNGKKVPPLFSTNDVYSQCFDVRGALREGENEIVLNTFGTSVPGYIFLGPTPLRKFPYMTETENRLWFDTVNFDAFLRASKIEKQLQASRAADDEKPLKMMANINLMDLAIPMAEKYGAYQHDTGGAGSYWCPMTGARISTSHGMPFSCEQAGPPATAQKFQSQITYYLMYGNDAVDLVFGVRHYRDHPEVAAWFDNHIDLIRCVGKMHLPTPQVAILRSSRVSRLGFPDPWLWDIGRGTIQSVGRNFAYIEVPDILNGVIDQFKVVIDDGTVVLTEKDIEGIKRFVERGGTFIAQHHTGRHTPEKADVWALAKAWGLTVTPKYISEENYRKWPLGRIHFAENQDLIPSLRGRDIDGSGVAIDSAGTEHGGAVSIASSGKATPVATWDDGSMAIADIRDGRGRFILLGTPFYLRMKDVGGQMMNDEKLQGCLDEFFSSIGIPRDSWTGIDSVWAEKWRSKNGVFDLYPVARMAKEGKETVTPAVAIRRDTPIRQIIEISAAGHPRVDVEYKEGKMYLPPMDYGLMQSRLFAVPRAEIARSAMDWFQTQAAIWRPVSLTKAEKPQPISTPEDVLALPDGWTLKVEGQPDRVVRPGAFATLGLPEKTFASFEKTVTIPPEWQGRRIELVFDAEANCWGILPQGKLYFNSQEAAMPPIVPSSDSGFTVDVTDLVKNGELKVRLDVDGVSHTMERADGKGARKPSGVTGIFYLQATQPFTSEQTLPGDWNAAVAFNRLKPVQVGEKVECLYLEKRFNLPKDWPAKRVFLESPKLGFLMLNGHALEVPAMMSRLDISGLVRKDGGENVLRWVPGARDVAAWYAPYKGTVPEMRLLWAPES